MLTRKENETPARDGLSAIERERIVSLPEAARLRGCSIDTLKRNDANKIIRLSPRRVGMRVRDALNLI